MYQDPDLPCGVTQSMCDGDDPVCQCGHYFSDHFYEDGEEPMMNHEKLERVVDINQDKEYNANGEVVYACDMYENTKNKVRCGCEGFNDEPCEPDPDCYWDDRD